MALEWYNLEETLEGSGGPKGKGAAGRAPRNLRNVSKSNKNEKGSDKTKTEADKEKPKSDGVNTDSNASTSSTTGGKQLSDEEAFINLYEEHIAQKSGVEKLSDKELDVLLQMSKDVGNSERVNEIQGILQEQQNLRNTALENLRKAQEVNALKREKKALEKNLYTEHNTEVYDLINERTEGRPPEELDTRSLVQLHNDIQGLNDKYKKQLNEIEPSTNFLFEDTPVQKEVLARLNTYGRLTINVDQGLEPNQTLLSEWEALTDALNIDTTTFKSRIYNEIKKGYEEALQKPTYKERLEALRKLLTFQSNRFAYDAVNDIDPDVWEQILEAVDKKAATSAEESVETSETPATKPTSTKHWYQNHWIPLNEYWWNVKKPGYWAWNGPPWGLRLLNAGVNMATGEEDNQWSLDDLLFNARKGWVPLQYASPSGLEMLLGQVVYSAIKNTNWQQFWYNAGNLNTFEQKPNAWIVTSATNSEDKSVETSNGKIMTLEEFNKVKSKYNLLKNPPTSSNLE